MDSDQFNPNSTQKTKISGDVFYDSAHCSLSEMSALFSEIRSPSFISSLFMTYSAPVKKIGNTHGFILQKKVISYLQFDVGDDVAMVLCHPLGNPPPKRDTPSKEHIDKLYKKYDYYFRFSRGATLSDFDFNDMGIKYHIPIYTRISLSGTSYAFTVAMELLELFGFQLNDTVNILFRKENPSTTPH